MRRPAFVLPEFVGFPLLSLVETRAIFQSACVAGSEKALRIDVHLHVDGAPLFRSAFEHGANEGLHVAAAPAVDQQAEAMPTTDQGKRRFCRSQYRDPLHHGC